MVTYAHPKKLKILVILLVFVMACMCSPTALLGSKTPPAITPDLPPEMPAPIEIATPEPLAATEAPVPTSISRRGDSFQADVPWLIISTSEGLFMANMDGTNPVPLVKKSFYEIDLQRAISSPAHKIAVQTSGQDYYHGLALQVISLPDGIIEKTISLSTKDTEPGADASPGDSILEAMRAIAEQPSVSWSPDGTQLAFTAALDSPKANIYVYDLISDHIQKVSDNNGQNFNPTWSPDGKSILFFEADGFGTGAGYAMKGLWLAAADGSSTKLLDPLHSGGGQLLGWRDDETAVLTSWSAVNGTNLLRLFNIRTQKQTVLEAGAIFGAAVASGIADDAGNILFAGEKGLFLVPAGTSKPQKISGEKVAQFGYPTSIRWQEDGRIFIVHFDDGSLSTFLVDGTERQDAPYNLSSGSLGVSSFGLIWAWTDRGGEDEGASFSGPGLNTSKIYDGPASTPMWNIDNDLLFFVGNEIYKATFNMFYTDAEPVASIDGDVLDAAWVGFTEALDNKYGP